MIHPTIAIIKMKNLIKKLKSNKDIVEIKPEQEKDKNVKSDK